MWLAASLDGHTVGNNASTKSLIQSHINTKQSHRRAADTLERIIKPTTDPNEQEQNGLVQKSECIRL